MTKKITLPKIGDTITPERGIELCRHFGFIDILMRIKANPWDYDDWKFDGTSMVPDRLIKFFWSGWDKAIIEALKHDLKYMYGIPGDLVARMHADAEYYWGLKYSVKMPQWLADKFHIAVRKGGKEGRGKRYSWAKASKKKEE